MDWTDILFIFFLIVLFMCGFYFGNLRRDIKETVNPTEIDYNNDGLINCKDIQREVSQCYKGKGYYVQNCRTTNKTDAHAWVKVWIKYIQLINGTDECKECITDVYGECI